MSTQNEGSDENPSNEAQVEARSVPLLPLRRGIVFPGAVVTVPVGRRRSRALAKEVAAGDLIAIGVQRDRNIKDPSRVDLHDIEVLARVREKSDRGNRGWVLIVEGLRRVELGSLIRAEPFWQVRYEEVKESGQGSDEGEALAESLRENLAEMLAGNDPLKRALKSAGEPGRLADLVAHFVPVPSDGKIGLLLELDQVERLRRAIRLVGEVKAKTKLKEKIDSEVRKELNKQQREVLLRQQLKAIKKELGEGGAEGEDSLEKKIEEAVLPEEVRRTAERELRRLEGMGQSAPEAHVIRKYLEWIVDLPWELSAEAKEDIDEVERVLEEDHEGLDEVKRRILEHMAVLKLNGEAKGTILCLVGPPGVGKTSLAQSVARATDRPLARISLGGIRDEAEIRGHRRTYVGSIPGRLIHALRKAGVKNPVIVLDEIDKLARGGWSGDPEAALLEVLDPEQNHTFTDHYMELPFDLSEVLFIATANDLSNISAPLRDRLEIIEISGYTNLEKERIAERHLLPKQVGRHGLPEGGVELAEGVLPRIISEYTREAGVRQLSRELAKLCRRVALEHARGASKADQADQADQAGEEEESVEPRVVSTGELGELLGRPRFLEQLAEIDRPPGVAAGLAWTPVGGDILYIETTRMPGKGKLEITGKLGEVMTESARAALAYLRTHAESLGIDPSFLESHDLHIHVPAGAVPKDGPSAGVTIFTALASLLTGRRVRPEVAMTGEATLRGRVLPIGGVKSKVLAAHRAGFTTVLLPKQNERDLSEIPEAIQEELTLVFAEDMETVLQTALMPEDETAPELGGVPVPGGGGEGPTALA